MTTALLLIDIQNEYFAGGKRELERPLQASECARTLLEHFRRANLPVVHIQHIASSANAPAFVAGTVGAEIHANVKPLENEPVFQKHYPNSFRETPLLDHLKEKGVSRLVIAGMMTHMCVDASARAAFDFGFECVIAHDACATRALKFGDRTVPADHVHRAFLAALNGTYGKVKSVEEIIRG
ncbi:MAG: cysteine hydrolase [Chloroflexi bacterium]|nr:cysteine hydrolase [Chloroflexota bacterium]